MKRLVLPILLLATIVVFGQNHKDDIRQVRDFDNIKASNGIKVYLVKGKPGEVRIKAVGVHLEDVITEVNGKTLKLSIDTWAQLREKNWDWNVEVEVPVDIVEEITCVTGARITGNFELQGRDLRISSNTGGELDLELHYDEVFVSASTGAIINLRGSTEYLEATSNMGSEVDLGRLKADFVNAKANMGGVLEIYAIKEADTYASMGGVIDVNGSPSRFHTRKSLGGDINPDND